MPKEFVVITSMEDTKINEIVVRAFEENNGRVSLEELTRRLVEGIKFDPVIKFSESDSRFDSYRNLDLYVYELKEGVVYRFPPIS